MGPGSEAFRGLCSMFPDALLSLRSLFRNSFAILSRECGVAHGVTRPTIKTGGAHGVKRPAANRVLTFGEKGWCAREDLNLQSFRNQILSLARLPFRHARAIDLQHVMSQS